MLRILRDNLIYGLNATNKVVSTRSTLPSLACVLLEANEGNEIKPSGLTLSATDLETALTLRLGAVVDAPFRLCVPSKELNSILAPRNEDMVEASVDEADLSIALKFGRAKPKLKGLDADEFPMLPDANNFVEDAELTVNFDTKDFLSSLEKVIFSAAEDEKRPPLTTVLFRFDKTGLTLITTDGNRMSLQTMSVVEGSRSYMIPASGLQTAVKLLNQFKPEQITLAFKHNQVMFVSDDFTILIQTHDGNYPDISPFERSLTMAKSHVSLNTQDLERALKTALVYNHEIKFESDDDRLVLKVVSQEHGNFEEQIETYDIADINFAVNAHFLLDIIRATKADTITILQYGQMTPVYVYAEDKINYWLMMPLHYYGRN